jgi:cell division septation protein DedD
MRAQGLVVVICLLVLAGCGDRDREPAPDPAGGPAAVSTPAETLPSDPLVPGPGVADRADPGDPARPAADPPERAAAGDADARYTVQVASFTNPESAELWTDRLSRQGLPVWTSVMEVGGRTYYRVRVGAAVTFSEAGQLGQALSERYEWPVWVAPLAAADRPPAGAVASTRRALAGN